MKQFPIKFNLRITIFCLAVCLACSKSGDNLPDPGTDPIYDPLKKVKDYVSLVMNDLYYWYEEVPKNLDPASYQEIEPYFEDLLYDQDHWSWMMNGETYLKITTGIQDSYGVFFQQAIPFYNDYGIRVAYVDPGSPLDEKGITRGWELTHLNGIAVRNLVLNNSFQSTLDQASNAFTFVDLQGQSHQFVANSREVQSVSVLKTMTFTPENYPGLPHQVGYMVYLTFNRQMMNELDQAFALFQGVQDFVLDLRYNGGGDHDVTEHLANYLAPAVAEGEIFNQIRHNARYSSWNQGGITRIHREEGALNLNRLFVLTTRQTASASEMIINGLKPFYEVICIGDTTYGKPNGMYVLPYPQNNYDNPEYVFLPICFFNVNKNGEGDFVDGILPHNGRGDDLYHDFGPEEDYLRAALQYIATGSFPAVPRTVSVKGIPGKALPKESKGYLFKRLPENPVY